MKKLFYIAVILFIATSCSKDKKLEVYDVSFYDVDVVTTYNSAVITAKYSYPSDISVRVLYSRHSDMSASTPVTATVQNKAITCTIDGLLFNTKYYYCFEYAQTTSTQWSQIKNFKTSDLPSNALTVITKEATGITLTSAYTGGIITSNGFDVQGRGVCYGTHQNPTVNDDTISGGAGTGDYTCLLHDLSSNLTYYAKAFAQINDTVVYGNEISFVTSECVAPEVSTLTVTNVSNITATFNGIVTDEGSSDVTARGFCWSVSPDPTLNDNVSNNGDGAGQFSEHLGNLQPNTTYYVKAYATNACGISYGEQQTFTTRIETLENCFSVNSNDKVIFSSGNLQFNPRTNTWRFAENQYDYVGEDNQNISSNYGGWLDLFGWATSGYSGCYPWIHTTSATDYGGGITSLAGTSYDWGVYNTISGSSYNWRTLTNDEWDYLVNQRSNASLLRSCGTVCGINGLILLPDTWVKPSSVSFTGDAHNWTTNTYNAITWAIMSDAHAIFLPAAGNRSDITVSAVEGSGGYWSSESDDTITAMYMIFTELTYSLTISSRHIGRSVRLVRDY